MSYGSESGSSSSDVVFFREMTRSSSLRITTVKRELGDGEKNVTGSEMEKL